MGGAARRRRLALGGALVGAIGVLALLAFGLAESQRDARRTLLQRFDGRPTSAAALIRTIVGQAFVNDAALAERLLADRTPERAALLGISTQLNGAGVLVVDRRGSVVASEPAGRRLAGGSTPHVRAALAGRPSISDTLRADGRQVLEIAVPFTSEAGLRVLVVRNSLDRVRAVLSPYLSRLTRLEGHYKYILDGRGTALASNRPLVGEDRPLKEALREGGPTHAAFYDGGKRRFSSVEIEGTPWRVVDSAPASVLYAPVSGWQEKLPWLVLIVLVPAAFIIAYLVDRAGRAADRARQASEAKSAFLASMSHELRTPMTTVIGFSDMLRNGKLGVLTERQEEVVGHIHNSSKHLNKLISEILDLSRVEEGRMTFHPEQVRPHVLVAEVVESMRGLADDHGVTIAFHAPDVGTFRLDPARLKQVLYNLIGNAINHTSTGGSVSVRLWRDEHDELGIEVTDTGSGIAPEDLERIFLPFEQGGGPGRNGGAGLGLAVSRRIVDAQGGRIGVRSSPGEGATFTVTLPRAS